jgi:hypothetical protein
VEWLLMGLDWAIAVYSSLFSLNKGITGLVMAKRWTEHYNQQVNMVILVPHGAIAVKAFHLA